MNIINSTMELDKNQNIALKQRKAATMVLNMLDFAMAYIPSFF